MGTINDYMKQCKMKNYVMMLVMKENNSSTTTGCYSSALAGHGMLLIHTKRSIDGSCYFIFHLQGWGGGSSRDGSSDSSFVASSINTQPHVRHFYNTGAGDRISIKGDGTYGVNYTLHKAHISAYVNFKNNGKTAPVIVGTPPYDIKTGDARKLVNSCKAAEQNPNIWFSLIGGAMNMGENCVTWVYNQLSIIGVGFDSSLYWHSFTHPWYGVHCGGQLGTAHISHKR